MSLAGGYTYSPCVSALSEEQIGVQAEKMEMSVLCGKLAVSRKSLKVVRRRFLVYT